MDLIRSRTFFNKTIESVVKLSEPTAKKQCKDGHVVCPLTRDIYIYKYIYDIRILDIGLEVARLVPVLYREYKHHLFCSFSLTRMIFHLEARRKTTSKTILSESFVWDNGEHHLR